MELGDIEVSGGVSNMEGLGLGLYGCFEFVCINWWFFWIEFRKWYKNDLCNKIRMRILKLVYLEKNN